jgi:uncharacterized protein with HEPN domain
MQLEALKYLLDISDAISDIDEFFVNVKGFNDYSSNKLLKAGVERKLILIGEAINSFRKIETSTLINNSNQIYGLRNRIAHAYDSVDDNTIYIIVVKHLPNLKSEINDLIEKSQNKK